MNQEYVSRSLLYKYLDIDRNSKELNPRKQYKLILKRILIFNELLNNIYLTIRGEYQLSLRQKTVKENMLSEINHGNLVNAYCEFLDYINDYDSNHEDKINTIEVYEIKDYLELLQNAIIKELEDYKNIKSEKSIKDFILTNGFIERITLNRKEVKFLTEEEVKNLKIKY